MYPAVEIDLHIGDVSTAQAVSEGCVWGHRSTLAGDSNEGTNLPPSP